MQSVNLSDENFARLFGYMGTMASGKTVCQSVAKGGRKACTKSRSEVSGTTWIWLLFSLKMIDRVWLIRFHLKTQRREPNHK